MSKTIQVMTTLFINSISYLRTLKNEDKNLESDMNVILLCNKNMFWSAAFKKFNNLNG